MLVAKALHDEADRCTIVGMPPEPTRIEFERVIKTLTLRTGWRSIEASFTYLVCGTCGAMVYDDAENKQKHANFHGEVERLMRVFHAHTRDFVHHLSGPPQ